MRLMLILLQFLLHPVSPLTTCLGGATSIPALGFGTYRVGDTDEHEHALRAALSAGITLIDTSANYANGAAEEAIGRVVQPAGRGQLRANQTAGSLKPLTPFILSLNVNARARHSPTSTVV